MTVSNDGRFMATGAYEDSTIKVFSFNQAASNCKELFEIKVDVNAKFNNRHYVSAIAMSNDNKLVVAGCFGGTIKAFDIETQKQLFYFKSTSVW